MTSQSRGVGANTQLTGGSSLKMQLGGTNIESNIDIKHIENNDLGIKSTKMNLADNRLSSHYINTS